MLVRLIWLSVTIVCDIASPNPKAVSVSVGSTSIYFVNVIKGNKNADAIQLVKIICWIQRMFHDLEIIYNTHKTKLKWRLLLLDIP